MYIDDFGLPLKRGLEVLPIGRLGVLFLYFQFKNARYSNKARKSNLIYAILSYSISYSPGEN